MYVNYGSTAIKNSAGTVFRRQNTDVYRRQRQILTTTTVPALKGLTLISHHFSFKQRNLKENSACLMCLAFPNCSYHANYFSLFLIQTTEFERKFSLFNVSRFSKLFVSCESRSIF